jgi:hypothetical protein
MLLWENRIFPNGFGRLCLPEAFPVDPEAWKNDQREAIGIFGTPSTLFPQGFYGIHNKYFNFPGRVRMNVQKIFDALHEDQENSELSIICGELEEQGYKVRLDGRDVTSAEILDGDHVDLEDKVGPLIASLYKDGSLEQEFTLEFIDDHEVVIERKIE